MQIHSLHTLLTEVSRILNVSEKEIKGRKRIMEIVHARKIFCYIANVYYRFSTTSIAKIIDRDHSTVIYSRDSIWDLIHIKDDLAISSLELLTKELELNDTSNTYTGISNTAAMYDHLVFEHLELKRKYKRICSLVKEAV